MTRMDRQFGLAPANGKYWCTAASFVTTGNVCKLNLAAGNDATHINSPTAAAGAGSGGKCRLVSNIGTYTAATKLMQTAWFEIQKPQTDTSTAITADAQFDNHTVSNTAGTNVSFKSGDNWTLFTGAISAQEVLEEAWLQAFYEHAVWALIKTQLGDAKTGGATAKAFP